MFLKEKNIFRIYALECGFDSIKTRGLFSKITPEGVSINLDRQIGSERSRFKKGKDGGDCRPEKKAARRRHGRKWQSSPVFSKLVTPATI
jgi:hypothetical protein